MPAGLSKSRFLAGRRCARLLWWSAHEPDAPELTADADVLARADEGRRVGEVARGRFPEGTLLRRPGDPLETALDATSHAVDQGLPVLFEASFAVDGLFVTCDVLLREGSGWRLVEVKAATAVSEEHLDDVAFQFHVLRRAGLDVQRAQVLHLDAAYRHPDRGDLFREEDVTAEAQARQGEVAAEARRLRALLEAPLPDVPVGPQCRAPRKCPFFERCWAGKPPDHVSRLYRGGRRAWSWAARGVERIRDLPANAVLGPEQRRQRDALATGALIVAPGLRSALAPFAPPVHYLDFETICRALPCWDGCGPYDQLPVQFSVHAEAADGDVVHHAWLAERGADPREALARALLDATAGEAPVLAYYASFERSVVRGLAAHLPRLSEPLARLEQRIGDLLPVVRDHVYHPDFGGGFGLKAVLPALVPEASYEGLEISDGGEAARTLERLLLSPEPPGAAEAVRLREALLAYCGLDTWGLVLLRRRLVDLSRAPTA